MKGGVLGYVRHLDKRLKATVAAALVITGLYFLLNYSESHGTVDPIVGLEHWSSGVERATALGVYRVWESADFKGGDLGFTQTKSVDQCLYACDEMKGCVYASWSRGVCYLKDAPKSFEAFKNRPSLFAMKRVKEKPAVSESWHDSEVRETSHSVYRMWDHTDFDGPDAKESAQANLEGCLQECDRDQNCLHVTFEGHRCRIKSDETKLKQVRAIGTKALTRVRMHNSPDPLVKHHWTKGGEQKTEDSTYQTWEACRFKGDDITAVKANSLTECLKECDSELFCRHVTLVGKECFLHGWAPEYFEIVEGRKDMWAAKQVERSVREGDFRAIYNGLPPDESELKDLRSDFLVGEMWDEAQTIETQYNRYRTWEGFDFEGGELHPVSLKLKTYSLEECLEECDHKPECTHVLAVVGKECWLKAHPFRLARIVDERTDVFAAMKLGRKGKRGLDSSTKHKVDRRKSSKRRPRRSLPFLATPEIPSISLPTPSSLMEYFKQVLVYGSVFGLIAGGAFWYSRKLQSRFYVSELS